MQHTWEALPRQGMKRTLGSKAAVVAVIAAVSASSTASAQAPPGAEAPTPAGTGRTVDLKAQKPTPKRVDGNIGDWTGATPGFAGASMYSRGELIYQDHVFDDYGAASDRTAQYSSFASSLEQIDPRTSRPVRTAYEFGNDSEGFHYGELPLNDAADLLELRIAADAKNLYVLTRTTGMTPSDRTALLLLLDTKPGNATVQIPWGSGLHSDTADTAVLLAAGRAEAVDLRKGSVTKLPPAVADSSAYTNAIEAAIPRALTGATPKVAEATGVLGSDGKLQLANVAFRPSEPVEPAFDRQQALALHDGTIDAFFENVNLTALTSGKSQRYEPGPGYHARSFTVSPAIADEFLNRGIHREYGVYLPHGYQPGKPSPLVTFLHGSSLASGASNHTYAALLPGFMRDFGDTPKAIVILPNDRQPKTPDTEQDNQVGFGDWMGESLVELNTVWANAARTFRLDPSRNYLTGYSMGGYGVYELAALMPDRWAAAMPIAGQVSSGDYTGADFQGCDQLHLPQLPGVDPNMTQIQRGDACYPTSRPNHYTDPPYEGYGLRHPDPRATNMLKIAENALNEPFAIFSPLEDENQVYTANLAAARTLNDLGYRYRMWTFLAEEHESPGIFDEWTEAQRYLFGFSRSMSPPRVRFARDMPLEHEVERGTGKVANPNVHLRFASAYWVRDIEPADAKAGHAAIDARSLAIPDPPHTATPEAGTPAAPGQTAPHLTQGQGWHSSGNAAPRSNSFTAKLTGASAATLDLAGMRLSAKRPIKGTVTTDHALTLILLRPSGGAVRIALEPGTHVVTVE
ncbi:MAG: alpha/beta hydrolase-fold protein [Gaiellaceae bacterium]